MLIAGMQLPPNNGRKYGDEFAGLFAAWQERRRVLCLSAQGRGRCAAGRHVVPGRSHHPVAAAHPTIWTTSGPVEPLLR